MVLSKLFKKTETLVSVDIGSTCVKLIEVDWSLERPRLVNLAFAPLSSEMFSNNQIIKPDEVGVILSDLFEQAGVKDRRVVTAMPSPGVFTKRIKLSKVPLDELDSIVRLEASNFIPHNIDAVKLDYHIIGQPSRTQIDVLVVAVKNEVVESFLESFAIAGTDVAVVDVDYFALQNAYEACNPDGLSKTMALINVGHRFSSINICKNGASLFTGDIAVGGKAFTDALSEGSGISHKDAEQVKKEIWTKKTGNPDDLETLERQVEMVAGEFNRQLSFYWSASGADDGIDQILLTGGGSQVPGLVEDLAEKTGVDCSYFDPLLGIEVSADLEVEYVQQMRLQLAVAMGMALRVAGDKIIPEFMNNDD